LVIEDFQTLRISKFFKSPIISIFSKTHWYKHNVWRPVRKRKEVG
jgi:hypothetical protein